MDKETFLNGEEDAMMREFYAELDSEYEAEMINDLAVKIFEDNDKKGFWESAKAPIKYRDNTVVPPVEVTTLSIRSSKVNVGEKLMLMVSELAEGMEAHRKGGLKDDHLPQYDGLHVELANCMIRILDFCGALDIPIGTIMYDKLEYNRNRPHMHGKKY